MNERSKELIEQAHNWTFQENRGQFVLEDFAEKLIELTVKECLDICQWVADDGGVEAEEPRWKIEEHFGVKE